MTLALSIAGVSVSYGQVAAVHSVGLDLERGTTATIIGANGAGKSTLLNAIAGILPMQGRISFFGRDIGDEKIEGRARSGLVLIPERRELFSSMTVEENLLLGGYTRRGEDGDQLAVVHDLFPRLKERRNQIAVTLSGGERQMLAMGRAMMSRPRVLMLDEPSLGLAPLIVRDILDTTVRLKEAGVSILLVEQNARAALAVADTAYVMENGQFILSGPARDIACNPRVAEIYMGQSLGP